MAFKVGVFWNLRRDDPEKTARIACFESALTNLPDPKGQLAGINFNIQDADGDFLNPDDQKLYNTRSQKLRGSDIYVTSCAPTFGWVRQLPPKPIVITGMFFPYLWLPNGGQKFAEAYGYCSYDITMTSKWLALLGKVFRALNQTCSQIGVLIDSRERNEGAVAIYNAIKQGTTIGVQQFAIEGIDKGPDQLLRQLLQFKSDYPAGGLIVPAATLTAINRQKLISYINSTIQLPAIYPNVLYTRAGGLISIGADLSTMYGAAGTLARKILLNDRTVSPGLQLWPSRLLLTALNGSTAAAMGYTAQQIAAFGADIVI